MNKRVFSLVLALVLALASLTVAFAESSPVAAVVTTPTVTSVVSATGVALPASFQVVANLATPATTALAAQIASAIQAGTVESIFGAEAVAAINLAIQGITTIGALKVNEVFPATVVNYDTTYGDVIVTMQLPTAYAPGATIVALVGYYNAANELVWVVADALINNNGDLVLTLSTDALVAGTVTDITVALLGV